MSDEDARAAGAAELLEPLIGRAARRTRVLVTHDVERAQREADVVLRLRAGRQVEQTRAAELYAS